MAQVIVRANLNLCGQPRPRSTESKPNHAFKIVAVTTGVMLILAYPLLPMYMVLVPIYVLFGTCFTRQTLRERYAIPEQSFLGCEDCCCAYWCQSCAVMQMARHTTNYYQEPAGCCTDTGIQKNFSNRAAFPNNKNANLV